MYNLKDNVQIFLSKFPKRKTPYLCSFFEHKVPLEYFEISFSIIKLKIGVDKRWMWPHADHRFYIYNIDFWLAQKRSKRESRSDFKIVRYIFWYTRSKNCSLWQWLSSRVVFRIIFLPIFKKIIFWTTIDVFRTNSHCTPESTINHDPNPQTV